MECPLRLFANINRRYCRTYLPDRVLFKQLGLSSFNSLLATIEYGISLGYISFANCERDETNIKIKSEAQKIKSVFERALRKPLRLHLQRSNAQIENYESRNTTFDEYMEMIGDGGENLFRLIVEPKRGEVDQAALIGRLLAQTTSLDNMIKSRHMNKADGHYNALISELEFMKGKELLSTNLERIRKLLGNVVNNDHLNRISYVPRFEKLPVGSIVNKVLMITSTMMTPLLFKYSLEYGKKLNQVTVNEASISILGIVVAVLLMLALNYCMREVNVQNMVCAGADRDEARYWTKHSSPC